MYYIHPSTFIKKYRLFIEDDTKVNLKLFLKNFGNNFDFGSTLSYEYYFKCVDYQNKSIYKKLPRWFIFYISEFTIGTISVEESLPYEKNFNQVYSLYITIFRQTYPNNKSIEREYKKFQKEYPEYIL